MEEFAYNKSYQEEKQQKRWGCSFVFFVFHKGMDLRSMVNGAMVWVPVIYLCFLWEAFWTLCPSSGVSGAWRQSMAQNGREGSLSALFGHLWDWHLGGSSGDLAFALTLALTGQMWSAVAGGRTWQFCVDGGHSWHVGSLACPKNYLGSNSDYFKTP